LEVRGVGYAQSEIHPLTLEDWLKEHSGIKNIGETEITAECKKRKTYNEVTLGKANIELNQHKKNKTNSDNYLDPFSITLWGWINSFGIRTADYDVFWHGKPAMSRWNTGHFKGSVLTRKLFIDIAQQGQFQFYLQPNPIKCQKCLSVTGKIKVSNPDVILNCFN
jgi:hypothetical protein